MFTGDSAARAIIALQGSVVQVPEVLAIYRTDTPGGSSVYSMEQYTSQDLEMIQAIAPYVPERSRREFMRLGLRYVIRGACTRFGNALHQGAPLAQALQDFSFCRRQFGWRLWFYWSWHKVAVKALLPKPFVQKIRDSAYSRM